MFEKGQAPGPGRPPGLKNKDTQNYLDLQVWAKMILTGARAATAKEMIEIGFRGLTLLLGKVSNLPGTPQDSLKNAENAANLLKELEQTADKPNVDS